MVVPACAYGRKETTGLLLVAIRIPVIGLFRTNLSCIFLGDRWRL
jgi:hypothetical protein